MGLNVGTQVRGKNIGFKYPAENKSDYGQRKRLADTQEGTFNQAVTLNVISEAIM